MKKSKSNGYLVFCRKQTIRMKGETQEIIHYQDKIIGFCNTEKAALCLARTNIKDTIAEYDGLPDYDVLEVTDEMLTGYEFDDLGDLDLDIKDKMYPYLIRTLGCNREKWFIMYIVSNIQHYC